MRKLLLPLILLLFITLSHAQDRVILTGPLYLDLSSANPILVKLMDFNVNGQSKFTLRGDGVVFTRGVSVDRGVTDLITRGGGLFFHHDAVYGSMGIGANTPPKTPGSYGALNIFIGDGAGDADQQTYRSSYNVAIGGFAYHDVTDGSRNIIIGTGTGYRLQSGNSNVLIGTQIDGLVTGSNNLAFGYGYFTNPSTSSSISLNAMPTESNQMVVGYFDDRNQFEIKEVYIGRGVANRYPGQGFVLSPTGGQGHNVEGGFLILSGGKSTGSAIPGSILFTTSVTEESGASPQELVERWRIDGSKGNLLPSYDNAVTIGSPDNRLKSLYIATGGRTGILCVDASGLIYVGANNRCEP